MLALLDPENNSDLGEEGISLAKVSTRVKPQDPLTRPHTGQLAEDILESVHGHLAGRGRRRVWQPDLDAAVLVGLGLEDLGRTRGVAVVVRGRGGGDEVGGEELELHAHALCRLADGGVEDMAGYAVFCCGRGRHFFLSSFLFIYILGEAQFGG